MILVDFTNSTKERYGPYFNYYGHYTIITTLLRGQCTRHSITQFKATPDTRAVCSGKRFANSALSGISLTLAVSCHERGFTRKGNDLAVNEKADTPVIRNDNGLRFPRKL